MFASGQTAGCRAEETRSGRGLAHPSLPKASASSRREPYALGLGALQVALRSRVWTGGIAARTVSAALKAWRPSARKSSRRCCQARSWRYEGTQRLRALSLIPLTPTLCIFSVSVPPGFGPDEVNPERVGRGEELSRSHPGPHRSAVHGHDGADAVTGRVRRIAGRDLDHDDVHRVARDTVTRLGHLGRHQHAHIGGDTAGRGRAVARQGRPVAAAR